MNAAEDRINFAAVTCADHKMLAAACCALLSIRDHLGVAARFFLIALDPTAEDAEAVQKFAAAHDLDIQLLFFESARLPNLSRGRWPPSVLARLFLDRILPDDLDRLLYVDADTLTIRPVDALCRISFMGKPAAAVDDFIMAFPKKLEARRQGIGLNGNSAYFNSGVILFDWKATLSGGFLQAARENIENSSARYHATDQDALNAALEGQWVRLSPRWNAQTGFLPEISKPVIVHFTGRRKPWQERAAWLHREYSEIYRSYLQRTPWHTDRKSGLPDRAASYLLHLGKKMEGYRKSRRLKGYVNRPDAGDVWNKDD